MGKTAKQATKNASRRLQWTAQGLVGAVVLYAIALRAIDSGSLWQYCLVLVLLIFVITRFVKVIRGDRA